MKKRSLSLLLASLMIVGCLAGCGKTDTKETEKSESKTETKTEQESDVKESSETTKEEELEKTTIQVMLMGPGKQKDADKVWSAFNEKLQEYVPNTTVEFTVVPSGEYKEKFNQMLASGEEVDLAWVGYCSPSQDVLTADGSLMPLDDLLDQYGQGIKETLGDKVLNMSRYPEDDQIYYLLSWQGLFNNKRAFIVPTEFAELAGATWIEDTQKVVDAWYADGWDAENMQKVFDQFDIYFKTLKDNGKLYSGTTNMFGGADPYCKGFSSSGNLTLNDIGVMRGDSTFTVVDSIQTDYFRVYAENSADFWKKGYIRSDIASVETNSLVFVQKDEKGALTPNAMTLRFHNYFTESTPDLVSKEFGMPMTLIGIEDVGYLGKGKETSMAIPYCADEPERAMMVLNAIYTEPDLYNILIYGIEGEHYTVNSDGTIKVADKYTSSDSNYGLSKWYIGTCANALVTQNDVPGYYDEMLEAEKDAIVDPFQNFVFDKTSVADVISSITAVDGEYWDIIEKGYAGDKWEETLNNWIKERQAAGVDKLIEEYQKQLDAYVKANNITSW